MILFIFFFRGIPANERACTQKVWPRTPPADVLEAIREVHQGGSPMSAEIARLVVHSFHQARGSKPQEPELVSLSAREEEILELIARGARSKEAAEKLSLAVSTVQTHLQNIYEKLHVRSRIEAVAKYWGK